MIDQCPECGDKYIDVEHTTSYESEDVLGKSFEAIVYRADSQCQDCGHWWKTERRGYYRLPGEVLKQLLSTCKQLRIQRDKALKELR
jgi:DNA-directed RNA polymerase subunit RPC12/RpoP